MFKSAVREDSQPFRRAAEPERPVQPTVVIRPMPREIILSKIIRSEIGGQAGLGSTQIMPSGVYSLTLPGGKPAPPAGNPNNTMSLTFSGVTNGNWQVCIRDWGDGGGAKFQQARLNFAIPTAASASISGKVMTSGGNGIINANVILTGSNLPQPLVSKTTSFGNYSFDGVPSGGTYIVTVQAKRFSFNNPSQVLNVQDNIFDANFVAEEK